MRVPDILQNLRKFSRVTDEPQFRQDTVLLHQGALYTLKVESNKIRHLHHTLHRDREKTSRKPLAKISRGQNYFRRLIAERHAHIDFDRSLKRRLRFGFDDTRRPQDRNASLDPKSRIEGPLCNLLALFASDLQNKTVLRLLVSFSKDLPHRIDHHLTGHRIDCRLSNCDTKTGLGDHSYALAGLEYDSAVSIPGDFGKDSRPMCLVRIVARILDDNGSRRPVFFYG